MSKSELKKIEKNLERSVSLQEYLLSHPDELDKLPKGAKILLGDDAGEGKSKKTFLARQRGGKWTFQPA